MRSRAASARKQNLEEAPRVSGAASTRTALPSSTKTFMPQRVLHSWQTVRTVWLLDKRRSPVDDYELPCDHVRTPRGKEHRGPDQVIGHTLLLDALRVHRCREHLVLVRQQPGGFGLGESRSYRVDAYPVAVSNYKGRGAMERFGPPAYDGMQKLVNGDEVNVMLLDEVLSLYGKAPIVLIKIDVEYHEKQVIEGAQKTIERYKPWLFVETTESKEILSMLPIGYSRGKRFNASPTWEFIPPRD